MWSKIGHWSGSRWVRVLFWAAFIFSFVMAVLPHPPRVPLNPSDKIQHIAAFVTLSILGPWAYPRLSLIRLFALLSFYGAVIEVIQMVPILYRDSEFMDWVVDTVAAGVSVVVVGWWRRHARTSRKRVAPNESRPYLPRRTN